MPLMRNKQSRLSLTVRAQAGMTFVEVSDADFENAREVLVNQVLPDWAERAGGDWAERWNASVGSVVGVQIGG